MIAIPTIPHNRKIHTQLVIGRTDGVTWEDVTGYLERATVELGSIEDAGTENQGGDSVVRRLDFTLRNERVYSPNWPDTISQDDQYIIGDDTDIIGDENDSAEALIDMLFNASHNNYVSGGFHPLDKQSIWNQFNGSYSPLLWSLREVVLRVAIQENGGYTQESGTTQKIGEDIGTGDGTLKTFTFKKYPVLPASEELFLDGQPMEKNVDYTINYDTGEIETSVTGSITGNYTYFFPLFAGYLGDSIHSSEDGRTVTCECRDYARLLQDTFILDYAEYGAEDGSVVAEDVIQQILDDYVEIPITLNTPSPSEFAITEYNIEYVTAWDAIQSIATQRGWFLGYDYDDETNSWKLTFKEPPRNKDTTTADITLTALDDIYTADLEISDAEVRNFVKVIYRDKNTGERASIEVYDQPSIDEYRKRAMQIEEAETSLIDTKEEARDFGNYALHDLKDLTGNRYINMPIFPQVNLYTGINLDDPRTNSEIEFVGVQSVRHELVFGDSLRFRTEVTGGNLVTGAHKKWLKMETRPGAGKPVSFPEQSTLTPPPKVKRFTVTQDGAELLFTWEPITSEPVTYQIRRGTTWETGQIVAKKVQSDTYRTKQILKGTHTYHIKAIDAFGNESINSAESSIMVNFLPGVVDVIDHDELKDIDGVMVNVVDLSVLFDNKFGLAHYYTLDDITTTWDDETEITWDEPTISGEGTYETQPIDLGGKIKVYAITNLLGTNENSTFRILEIAYFDDNNNWSAWELFNGGVYEARYFKFRITLISSGNQNIINEFDIEFNAPEFTQRGSNVIIQPGGTAVTFPESFNDVPSIMLTVVGDANPRLTSQSKTGFTAKVVDDAGSDIGGIINWTATGY